MAGGIERLVPDKRNANKGTPRGRALLEDSLRRYGAGRSILADKHGNVIAGNKTLEAAADIGLPVRFVETDGTELVVVQRRDLDLDTPQARSLAYADNRVAELDLDWDVAALLEDRDSGLDLAAVGFSDDELTALLAGVDTGTEGLTDPDAVPAVPDEPVTKPGDLWMMGRHRIGCIDATDAVAVAALINSAQVSMVWADPPYGIDLLTKRGSIGLSKEYEPILNDHDTVAAIGAVNVCRDIAPVQIWWGANYYADTLPPSPCWIVWDKDHHGMTFADAELAWVSASSPVRCFRHAWSGADRDSERGEQRVHPNQKPVALAVWAFDAFGRRGDIVFDPFLGSGMSIIAAEQTGRTLIGCELSPAYCDVIVRRWEEFTGQEARRGA